MKYYVDVQGMVWSFEDDVKDIYAYACVPKELKEITEAEAKRLSNPPKTQEEIDAEAKAEAERIKEETLATLTVKVSTGKVFYADLASKVDIESSIRNAEEKGISEMTWKLAEEFEGYRYVTVTLAELKEASFLALKAKEKLVGIN